MQRANLKRHLPPQINGWPEHDEETPATNTIVRYTDRESPRNDYPRRMISPSKPGPCCVTQMQPIGTVQEEGGTLFQYHWCSQCGFTVRRFLVKRFAVLETDQQLLVTNTSMRNFAAERWAF